jgi:hypothetical protein
MIDYSNLKLGENYDYLVKGQDGEYTKFNGTLRAIFLNNDDYVSGQFQHEDTTHDVKLAQLDTTDEMINKLKDIDIFADEHQKKLEEDNLANFEKAHALVKEKMDAVFG